MDLSKLDVGTRIREIRKEKELTLTQLAEKSGVSQAYLSQLENGVSTRPSIDMLLKITSVFNMTLSEFVDSIDSASILQKTPIIETPAIEVFENQYQNRNYLIELTNPKFSSICPVTKELDYATVKIDYVPDKYCIEFRSLRRYMRAYYNQSISHEATANKILTDIIHACKPVLANIEITWDFVDGTQTVIRLRHPDAPPPLNLKLLLGNEELKSKYYPEEGKYHT